MESTEKKSRGRRKLVARVGELEHGRTKKFLLKCRGNTVEAFLVSYEGAHYAYLNRCKHISLSLDWVDNRFFTEDNRYLICANHGATYDPTSGECIWGPCLGAFLQSVPLEVAQGKIFAFCPSGLED
ncbi:MAG TPA: Rieske 2Fe-2S domain-containing protein [Candidatus Binatia bacterium]|jgi:nitrite reductase/ring-hydroxylating ferredoxin subunit